MRFLGQDLSSGATELCDGPAPAPQPGFVRIRTVATVVSAGTERMLVEFGQASLLNKARQQPERVREVLDKARTDGVATTVAAVRSKLAQPIQMGYANAGIVLDVGADVGGIVPGQLVASNGPHADLITAPATLVATVPEGVAAEHAAFASLSSIALQGLRLAEPQLGERFVVTGLGLIGLLAVQLLRAHGCEVLGIDPSEERRRLAEGFGAATAGPGPAAEELAAQLSHGRGVDGVLICAATKSSDPVQAAARMCRRRGRIVLVGVVGLELERSEFYEKELSFQVSSSYGPGRYDERYEHGADYPFGLVRWTAGRNMEASLAMMASGRLDLAPLITHRYAFDDAPAAYSTLVDDPTALGIVLEYPTPEQRPTSTLLERTTSAPTRRADGTGVALIGAGNFATRVLAPAIAKAGRLDLVAARTSASAALLARTTGARATTDLDAVFTDPAVGSVFVATRHDSHAELAARALRAGKHVYVEKPLAVSEEQLDALADAIEEVAATGSLPLLAVGFNRRFAPLTQRMLGLLDGVSGPRTVLITVNAGALPGDHWTQDPTAGGGRIIGEACHFIDLARHLVGHPITDVQARYLGAASRDSAAITLGFADGSLAQISYLATGSPKFPKERVEVFAQGRVLVNDNFRVLRSYGWPGVRTTRLRSQDKGHEASVAAFLTAVRLGGAPPIPVAELLEVSRAVLAAGPS